MAIWSFINRKGGVSKTLLCLNVAYTISVKGRKVTIYDTDPQGQIYHAKQTHGDLLPFQVIYNPEFKIDDMLNRKEIVLVDTSSAIDEPVRIALRYSNLCIVPIKPCMKDLTSSLSIRDMAVYAKVKNPALRLLWVITQVKFNISIAGMIKDRALAEGLPLAITTIPDVVAFMEADSMELPLALYAPRHPAIEALNNLCEEIL